MIEVKSIKKRFGNIEALKGVSFFVGKGEIFGIFGPNGAGKTTLIKIILGILFPDEGEVIVENKSFGYIPEEMSLYRTERVQDIINYMLDLKRINKKKGEKELKMWDKVIEIGEFIPKRVKDLSKGQRQKIMFFLSLLGDPSILIYDEPFTGLDPLNSQIFQDILIKKKKEGKTILFSTHILEQAENLCDRILIINKGSVVEYGKIEEIKKKYSKKNFIIEFEGEERYIYKIGNISILREGVAEVEDELELEEIVERLKGKIKIRSIKESLPSLKSIYIRLIGSSNDHGLEI